MHLGFLNPFQAPACKGGRNLIDSNRSVLEASRTIRFLKGAHHSELMYKPLSLRPKPPPEYAPYCFIGSKNMHYCCNGQIIFLCKPCK